MSEARTFDTTGELLAFLLEGGGLDPEDLDRLIVDFRDEDQHLDYKSGLVTQKKEQKELARAILKWVTGFANAEGGALIVGVSEPAGQPREVTGVSAPGDSPIREWAARILTQVVGYLSPPPQISSVLHPRGQVLVIAVARAPQLAPYITEGQLRYALRIGDSTVDVPPYLISDLVLGRRNHPILELREANFSAPQDSLRGETTFLNLQAELLIDNLSLIAAEDTSIGAIAWSLGDSGPEPNRLLRQYLTAERPTYDDGGWGWSLRHTFSDSKEALIRPFDVLKDSFKLLARLPRSLGSGWVELALYLKPRTSPPTWFSVAFPYSVTSQGHKHWLGVEFVRHARIHSDPIPVRWATEKP